MLTRALFLQLAGVVSASTAPCKLVWRIGSKYNNYTVLLNCFSDYRFYTNYGTRISIIIIIAIIINNNYNNNILLLLLNKIKTDK